MLSKITSHRVVWICLALALALSLGYLAVGLARAQQPPTRPQPEAVEDVAAIRSNFIPVQGRLTDAAGMPLNGNYDVTFRLYSISSGGSPLCSDDDVITAEDGLFYGWMDAGECPIDGRQLYLGIEVEDDGEMTPRQYFDNVPVAWTLRPGAEISYTLGSNALLDLKNWATSGRALRAYAMAATGENYAVVGAAVSPAGYGGYFYNTGAGTGLYGSSDSGAAIRAGGSGVIQSVATTYLWISGSNARKYQEANSTVIDMDTIGGAYIKRGADGGTKNIMLPVTIPGTLYGQEVRLTGLDIYWSGQTEFDDIVAVLMRRQTGVCAASSCYVTILHDSADHVCDVSNHPTGCVQHYDLTTNNVLTADSGVVYLTIELAFNGSTTWVDLGGARLTLEYDD